MVLSSMLEVEGSSKASNVDMVGSFGTTQIKFQNDGSL